MNIRKMLIPRSKYPIKSPYAMNPEFYVVHNTYNDAPAYNEISFMTRNDKKVSFHYAVDDREIIQAIPENRNAWHAGDGGKGEGNRKGIGIEICYSKSGGPRFIAAEKKAAEFIAQGLMEKGWGIDKVKKHQDFSGKYCPHRTLDKGWDRFLKMVESYMVPQGLKLIINGKQRRVTGHIEGGVSYIKVDGRNFPVRTLGEALGFKVGWDNINKAVIWSD